MLKYFSSAKPYFFSQLYHPIEAIPKENVPSSSLCKSFKLMLKSGFISPASHGIYAFMPLAMLSLEKLCSVIDVVMRKVSGQKMLFPSMVQGSLWKKSGRWQSPSAQLFKLKDRHEVEYCLGPTHEEAATCVVARSTVPRKGLPLRIYQISTKFRDELNPKLGLLRGREFIMKDMYTFDSTEETAKITYSEICAAYDSFFQLLGINHIKVQGSNAGMGGSLSHEYHFLSDVGEDELIFCPKCKTGMNKEVADDNFVTCPECNGRLQKSCGIEVGHAFYLGTAYSEPFQAMFKSSDGDQRVLQMGCYGLGVTRILAASVECLSETENLRWPLLLAPFLVSVIPPKKGSREESASSFVPFLCKTLLSVLSIENSVVVDDRINISIGKRIQEANALGIPYSVIAGSRVLEPVPKLEVIDNYSDRQYFMTHAELSTYFHEVNKELLHKSNCTM